MGILDRFRRKSPRDRFAEMLIRRIKAAGDPREVYYDPETFCLTASDRGAITNLSNLFAEYERADKEECERVVKNFLAAWFTTEMELPASIDDAQADILLALRSRSYYEVGVALMSDELEPNPQLPYVEVAGCLAVTPIYDLPTSIRSLSADDLEKWGVTLYEALEIGKQNLRESTREVAESDGLFLFASRDSHDAARMLLTDLIGALEVDGDPIAMVPNREMLVVAGSNDTKALEQMAAIGSESVDHERGISGVAFRLEDDEWFPWLPPGAGPLRNQFAVLRAQSVGSDYAQQQHLLQKKYEREGRDVFVSSYSAMQDADTGEVRTYCAWTHGIEMLLPRSDYIVLLEPEKKSAAPVVAAAEWSKVERVVGDLLTPVDMYPMRYRVNGFPTEEQLAEIGVAEWAAVEG